MIHAICSKVLRANNIQRDEYIEEQNGIKKLSKIPPKKNPVPQLAPSIVTKHNQPPPQ